MNAFVSSIVVPTRSEVRITTCHVRISRHVKVARLSPRAEAVTTKTETTPGKTNTTPQPLPSGSRTALTSSFITFITGGLLPLILTQTTNLSLSDYTTHYVMLLLLLGFGTLHSGLASLRPLAIQLIGERLYRVLFALLSLPSAGATIAYFISHRYDGASLWTIQGIPYVHEAVLFLTTLSFLLLYPATFDLAQVAAIKRPRLTIFESGVTRISRHPQLWGQVLWCVAHTAWLGSSFSVVASCGLIAHHLFGVWNGDRRLRDRFGEVWSDYANRTSILPFVAIADGRQEFRPREYMTPAYLGVTAFIIGAYMAHPAMLRAVGWLNW